MRDKFPDDLDLYAIVYLNPYLNFFQRVWVAIKYVFGYKSEQGDFFSFMLKDKDVDRLEKLLIKYKELRENIKNINK